MILCELDKPMLMLICPSKSSAVFFKGIWNVWMESSNERMELEEFFDDVWTNFHATYKTLLTPLLLFILLQRSRCEVPRLKHIRLAINIQDAAEELSVTLFVLT